MVPPLLNSLFFTFNVKPLNPLSKDLSSIYHIYKLMYKVPDTNLSDTQLLY